MAWYIISHYFSNDVYLKPLISSELIHLSPGGSGKQLCRSWLGLLMCWGAGLPQAGLEWPQRANWALLHMLSYSLADSPSLICRVVAVFQETLLESWAQNQFENTSTSFCWAKWVTRPIEEWRQRPQSLMGKAAKSHCKGHRLRKWWKIAISPIDRP